MEESKLGVGKGMVGVVVSQGDACRVSLQRSSDLNMPGSEANMAKPSEQGHL